MRARIVIIRWFYSTQWTLYLLISPYWPVLCSMCYLRNVENSMTTAVTFTPHESTVTFLLIGWPVLVCGTAVEPPVGCCSSHLAWLVMWVCLLTHNSTPPSTYRLPSDSSVLQLWRQTFWKLLISFLCFTSPKSPLSLFCHFGSHSFSLKGLTLEEVAANQIRIVCLNGRFYCSWFYSGWCLDLFQYSSVNLAQFRAVWLL